MQAESLNTKIKWICPLKGTFGEQILQFRRIYYEKLGQLPGAETQDNTVWQLINTLY